MNAPRLGDPRAPDEPAVRGLPASTQEPAASPDGTAAAAESDDGSTLVDPSPRTAGSPPGIGAGAAGPQAGATEFEALSGNWLG